MIKENQKEKLISEFFLILYVLILLVRVTHTHHNILPKTVAKNEWNSHKNIHHTCKICEYIDSPITFLAKKKTTFSLVIFDYVKVNYSYTININQESIILFFLRGPPILLN